MQDCYICGKPGAEIPDPCCGAPDCGTLQRRAHLECLSPERQREELAFIELMFVDFN